MNKIAFTSILAVTIAAAGIFAFISLEKTAAAPSANPLGNPLTTSNLLVGGITLSSGQLMVLIDNAGIGGKSSVEITWRFASADCQLVRVDGTAPSLTLTPISDDGALGGNPAHSDQASLDALVLTNQSGMTCTIDPSSGQYISVSTVGSSP